MYILTIRTDKPEAELGVYDDDNQLGSISWEAHRQLAETIHQKIKELLGLHHLKITDIKGILIFAGPGSFTGLRIGFSVANALGTAIKAPILASSGQTWTEYGLQRLQAGENERLALPVYGSEPHITLPKT